MLTVWHRLLEEQGFATLAQGLRDDEATALLEELSGSNRKSGRAGVRHVLKCPGVSSLAHNPRLLGSAQQILGAEAFPFRATLFDKSVERNWLIAWHQDTALPVHERYERAGWGPWSIKDGIVYAHAPSSALAQVLALRVHLDESGSDNGPLRVLPGTHTFGVLNDEEIHRLSKRFPEVTCEISRGGILAMRPLLIHSSSKLRAKIPRRVLHLEYAARLMIDEGLMLALA